MKPADHCFFFKEDSRPTQTAGGLHIVTKKESPTLNGTVTEVGPDVKYVKPGDRLTLHKKDSHKLEEMDVWSVLENPDKFVIW